MSIYNRAEIIHKNFTQFVKTQNLPKPHSETTFNQTMLKASDLIEIFESQVKSRALDIVARRLKERGECFYTISSAGHEGNAGLGFIFKKNDLAFLHYRSGGFFIQRSQKDPSSSEIYNTLLSLVASKEDPISGGRHKVWGSKELYVPPQTSTIASHLPKAVGAALSIKRAKDLKIESTLDNDSVVLCSFGDASANHSTAQGAINSASWVSYQNIPLPLVFICEDNGTGISVPTPEGWIYNSFSKRPGLNYIHADGLNICDVVVKARRADLIARVKKQPVFFHIKTVRLMGHAGSDIEMNYRSLSSIELAEKNDPLLHTARIILENNLLSGDEICHLYERIFAQVEQVAEVAISRQKITCSKEVALSIEACSEVKEPSNLLQEGRPELFARDYKNLKTPMHLAKLLNWGLIDILHQYKNTVVFGEDVAAKGGVYHVTSGLSKKFGSKRVFNSLLDEQSILGTAIGFAHNGFVPIPEIQFLAYLHNAEDQIRGEAATLSFFSKGQFVNPMVVRVAGLAYQRGFGGHFHNDNSLAVLRDIPGLIIAVPSNGEDAVKMLRTCVREAYERGRVCIFIEPIALYMTKDLYEEGDKKWLFPYPEPDKEIALGEYKIWGDGGDAVILTYGNGLYHSLKAQQLLQKKNSLSITVVDLRWIYPMDEERIKNLISKFNKVLIVDECRKTGSWGEALMTLCATHSAKADLKLLAAEDCFIPLGVSSTSTLPNPEKIINSILELCGE